MRYIYKVGSKQIKYIIICENKQQLLGKDVCTQSTAHGYHIQLFCTEKKRQ